MSLEPYGVTLDLVQVFEDFVRVRLPDDATEADQDDKVLEAVQQYGRDHEARQTEVLGFLNRYHVLMGYTSEARHKVAEVVIAFADEHPSAGDELGVEQVITHYDELVKRLQTVAPIIGTSETPRGVGSLASKALWCCFPESVPLLDDYAFRTLQILRRLLELPAPKAETPYGSFVEVWWQLYEVLRPTLEGLDPSKQRYKVRVVDRFLWYLGQPSFR